MRRLIRRNIAALLLISLLSVTVTGCWDNQPIEERSIVAALAIDKAEQEYEATVQIPVPALIVGGGGDEGGGGGKGGPDSVQLFTGRGKSLAEALLDIQTRVNYPLFYGHTQILLLSEEVAREGISNMLDFMRRHPEFRRRLWPVIVTGKAKDALVIRTRLEQIPTTYLRNLIETNLAGGKATNNALGDLYMNLSDPHQQVILLNVVEAEESDYKLKALAVFKGDKMMWSIPHPLSNPAFHIIRKKKGWNMVVQCPGDQGNIVFRPTGVKRRIKINAKPRVDIDVEVEGNVEETTCRTDLSKEHFVKQLENRVKVAYERQAQNLVREAYRERGIDLFKIHARVHAFHPELSKTFDRPDTIRTLPVNIRYTVQVRRIGLEAQ
ncbi:Ger(x)C family spore germination protein [Staphylospora marina]|uniref:Ger(x)C family spore germination protein n=1 Tax=Staphylospora marina TaxID=2490858 RepID=UPI000F5BD882|nr:Ger(x)C family spore germination protein [Staphylospora marina]